MNKDQQEYAEKYADFDVCMLVLEELKPELTTAERAEIVYSILEDE